MMRSKKEDFKTVNLPEEQQPQPQVQQPQYQPQQQTFEDVTASLEMITYMAQVINREISYLRARLRL